VDHFWPIGHRFLPFDRENLENGKSQRLPSARRELSKTEGTGRDWTVAPGESTIRKYVAFLSIFSASPGTDEIH